MSSSCPGVQGALGGLEASDLVSLGGVRLDSELMILLLISAPKPLLPPEE